MATINSHSLYVRPDMTAHNNYAFLLRGQAKALHSLALIGLIKDDSFSINLSTEMEGGKSQIENAINNANSSILTRLRDFGQQFFGNQQLIEAWTIKRPTTYPNLVFNFKAVKFEGLKLFKYTTPSFKQFNISIGKMMFPQVKSLISSSSLTDKGIGEFLDSSQTPQEEYFAYLNNLDNKQALSKQIGFSLSIGNFFHSSYGWFITKIDQTIPYMFDAKGQPVVWEIDIEVTYFKQITAQEWTSWWDR